MKACLTALFLCAACLQLSVRAAEPADAERKTLQETKAKAEKGDSQAQFELGQAYQVGEVVPKDYGAAAKWFRLASEQGHTDAQVSLGWLYYHGNGVGENELETYKWWLVAATRGNQAAMRNIRLVEERLHPFLIAEGQKQAREFRVKKSTPPGSSALGDDAIQSPPDATGTGFFITDDGYFITNQHVAGEGATVRLVTAVRPIAAKVVKVDKANDLALLKAEGKFMALPVIASRTVRLGATVATVGFPNTGLQGFAPKMAKGEIASLAGAQDDARHFQISAPIQPGNSGGALVDERGNVIGVVVAKLNQRAALATSGALAENVNYAVKSSYLLSFLESVPDVAAKLKEPGTQARRFEDVVKSVEQATVLVLVY